MEEEETLLGILSRPAKRSNRLKRYKWILIPTGALFLLLALAGTTAVSQSIVPLSSTPTAAAAVVPIESPSLSFYSAKIIPTPTATLAPSHTPTRIARRRYLSYQPHSGFHNRESRPFATKQFTDPLAKQSGWSSPTPSPSQPSSIVLFSCRPSDSEPLSLGRQNCNSSNISRKMRRTSGVVRIDPSIRLVTILRQKPGVRTRSTRTKTK